MQGIVLTTSCKGIKKKEGNSLMKKTIQRIIILLSVLCMAGCGTASKEGKQNTNIFQIEETWQAGNPDDSEVLGEVLEQISDTGVGKYNVANRWLSHDSEQSRTSLFCIDADTGVVYFVNQYQDYYIYRLKDGKAELAVPMPAKELYMWDGVLYFMVEHYDRYELQGMKRGDIYAYTPAKGTVEPVYAVGAMAERENLESVEAYQRLTVNKNGIAFVAGARREQMQVDDKIYNIVKEAAYVLLFGETEPVADTEERTYPGWGEYFLAIAKVEDVGLQVVLEPRNSNKTAERVVLGRAYSYFGLENDVYLMSGHAITQKNLITGEEMVFDSYPMLCDRYTETLKENGDSLNLQFFTITEDSIWAINTARELFRFDRRTGEATWYRLSLDSLHAIGTDYGMLYTDGKQIYVVTERGLAQILTEEVIMNELGEQELRGRLLLEE